MNPSRLFLLVYCGLFVVPVLVTLGFTWRAVSTVRSWERTTGTITEVDLVLETANMEVEGGGREDVSFYVYYPVVTYPMPNGETHEFRPTSGYSRKPSYQEGDQVPVYFDPNAPREARMGDFAYLWRTPVLLGTGTVLLMAVFGLPFVFLSTSGAIPTLESMQAQRAITSGLVDEAEGWVDLFLDASGRSNYDAAWEMMGESAREGMGREAFEDYTRRLADSHGKLVGKKRTRSSVKTTRDGNARVELFYTLDYERGTAKAEYVVKRTDGVWIIAGYNLKW